MYILCTYNIPGVHVAVRKQLKQVDVDALIEKGAKVKSDKISKKSVCLNLRIPYYLLQQVDSAFKNRVGMNRTRWILEAIQQKLDENN